ncbi:hypothetical protein L596_016813 [Steinernema carpocapsae]|uniref:Uncharacterized protein n=1 Tax=Steinernema carpocapsae TaxID=34508 RepID=A0A4U5NKI4_STECR|nr:hypothetical protein L596_016813 [Steinernema carpocapsae]
MNLVCFILLASCVATTYAAVAIYPTKIGEKVVLNLGPNINTWQRSRTFNGKDVTETIVKCIGSRKTAKCFSWTNVDTHKATPTKTYVDKDGQLVIVSYQPSDAGQYGSPDEPMRGGKNPDGSMWMLPQTAIDVVTLTKLDTQ